MRYRSLARPPVVSRYACCFELKANAGETPEREIPMLAIKNVLVPTDFGGAADAALLYGRELAGRFGATLHVVHVVENIQIASFPGDGYGEMAATLQAELEKAARLKITERVVDSDGSGPPTVRAVISSMGTVASILEYARAHKIDLIVMGTNGRAALAHLMMGSVAERVVRLAPCPVLTVHHPEREFVWPDALVTVEHA
jgi:nucleotide-binding universal stress UspA family protein